MNDFGLLPEPPVWALDAGLPRPYEQEGFTEYVTRLGLDPEPLLVELTERTICAANGRLSCALARSMPLYWDAHIDSVCCKHIDITRRREIEKVAVRLFPDSYRYPYRPHSGL